MHLEYYVNERCRHFDQPLCHLAAKSTTKMERNGNENGATYLAGETDGANLFKRRNNRDESINLRQNLLSEVDELAENCAALWATFASLKLTGVIREVVMI